MKCVVRSKKTGKYVGSKGHWRLEFNMVDDISKARVFNNPAGALMSVGSAHRHEESRVAPENRCRRLRHWYKYHLPEDFEIITLTLVPQE